MDSIIDTPRLRLTLLKNTDEGSRDLRFFHEHWSDPESTTWSLHGVCKNIEESREWMIVHMTKYKTITYAVHIRDPSTPLDQVDPDNPGVLAGSMGLAQLSDGPTVPLLPMSKPSEKPLNLRALGYAFAPAARGKGYATETAKALLSAYSEYCAREKNEFLNYIEAGVSEENPESLNVLKKIGFQKAGWKAEEEPVFLGGAWRHDGYWLYGLYVGEDQ